MNVDAITLADVLRRIGRIDEVGGIAGLLTLGANVPSASNVRSYATIVRARPPPDDFDLAALETRTAIASQADPIATAEALRRRSATRPGRAAPGALLALGPRLPRPAPRGRGEPADDSMCNQHTRIIVLATEKAGKSLLIRQVAFCAAAGIHPFTFKPIKEPVRVLLLTPRTTTTSWSRPWTRSGRWSRMPAARPVAAGHPLRPLRDGPPIEERRPG